MRLAPYDDASAADLIQAYEARIAALERLVGKQALALEFLRGASASVARTRSAPTSVITGPAVRPEGAHSNRGSKLRAV